MATIRKNAQKPTDNRHLKMQGVEAPAELVDLEFQPEVLAKAIAAAKAGGQTTSEWICGAVAESIDRRSEGRRNPLVSVQ